MLNTYISLILHDTVALITIINPIAAASIMVTMLPDEATQTIRPIAFKATLTVIVASLVTLFGGEYIFKFFGINVFALKIIGGIILMLIAVNMAYGYQSKNRHSTEEHKEAEDKEDISVVPIGIPILFGPGSIATIIVLNSNISHQLTLPISYTIVSIAILLASVIVFFTLFYATNINRILGVTGMKILTRIMGLIVGAIAAQFLVSGIKSLWGL